MAAPRATQWVALRNLARGSHSHQVRSLHMTGPATYASPALMRDRPMLDLPRDIASLRAECRRRRIEATGSKQDLIKRINADELTQSRAFSAAVSQTNAARPTPNTPSGSTTRHFNTTRALKSPGDTSTIDFAYLPNIEIASADTVGAQIRVPILPTTISPQQAPPEIEEAPLMKPEILPLSADAVFLPMAENHDGHAMNVDFHAMADRIANNLRRMQVPVEQQAGMMKRLWNDMVDDMVRVGERVVESTKKQSGEGVKLPQA